MHDAAVRGSRRVPISAIFIAAAAFVVGGPATLAAALLGVVALRRWGWRYVGWCGVAVVVLAGLVTVLSARPTAAFGVWVTRTTWPQTLTLSGLVLVTLAAAASARGRVDAPD